MSDHQNPADGANPTVAVNPSEASVAALAQRPDDDAIIMVNLLRYRPDGRAAYARYGAVAGGTVRARGGYPALSGSVADQFVGGQLLGDQAGDWETVILVRYPRRAAYLDMQTDPAYVGAIPDRTAGLSARLLYPFHPVDGADPDDPFRIRSPEPDETLAVHLVRWNDPAETDASWPTGATVDLRLRADLAMVTDTRFDELVVTRHDGTVPLTGLAPPGAAHSLSLRLGRVAMA